MQIRWIWLIPFCLQYCNIMQYYTVYRTMHLLSLSSVLSSQWCNTCRLYQTLCWKEDIKRHYICSLSFLSVRGRTSVATGLVGCIRMLDVNNRVLNLQENGGDSLYGSGVGECGNNPCQPNPCKNGAACQVKEAEMFHCKCSKGFWGKMPTKGRWCSSAVSQMVILGFLASHG